MFKQYFSIICFYFFVGLNSAQINTFTVISAPDIKTLGNRIQDKKNEGFIYHVLDSITKNPQSPNLAKSADGKLFKTLIKNNALYFTSSSNEGASWLEQEIFIDSLPKNNLNPLSKSNQWAYTVCNKSMGRIYVCWSDAKNGIKNNDVYLTYSDDGGKSWLDRILITYYPNHRNQLMPRLSIDEASGYLYFLYCDQKNYYHNDLYDVYLAVSRDNGRTFEKHKINSASIKLKTISTYSKYFSLVVKNKTIYPFWVEDCPRKKYTIHSTVLNDANLKNSTEENSIYFDKSIKVVYSKTCNVGFYGAKEGSIEAYIYNPIDPTFVPKLVLKSTIYSDKNTTEQVGNKNLSTISVDFEKLKLPRATYVLMLYNNGTVNYVWILEE